jgi:hypothetical protein
VVPPSQKHFSKAIEFNCEHRTVMKQAQNIVLVGVGQTCFVVAPLLEEERIVARQFSVERKLIEDLDYYPPLDGIAFAGKTLSKLWFLGKETARCNIKLHSICDLECRGVYPVDSEGGLVTRCHYLPTMEGLCLLLADREVRILVVQLEPWAVLASWQPRDLGIQRVLDLQPWLDRLCILERFDSRFYYVKLLDLDTLKSEIISRDLRPMDFITVSKVQVQGCFRGTGYLLANGLWLKVGPAVHITGYPSGVWLARGATCQRVRVKL